MIMLVRYGKLQGKLLKIVVRLVPYIGLTALKILTGR